MQLLYKIIIYLCLGINKELEFSGVYDQFPPFIIMTMC